MWNPNCDATFGCTDGNVAGGKKLEDTKRLSDETPQGEVLISGTAVGKVFCRDLRKSLWYGIQDSSRDLFPVLNRKKTPQLRPQEFWANRDISFEVRRGECLGLIGSNGAGKTTLLKMLTGLIKPDEGEIRMRGRIGALIALGAGFNPVLTGRENIYVYGSILGLSKLEIKKRLEEVVDFADIPDAIDAPVRTYSSGMQVRLGFATAVVLLEPDILILDEVLAVGDVAFRVKCYNAVDRLRENTAVILVSHSEEHIGRVTERVLLLDQGRVSFSGPTSAGLQKYRQQQSSYLITNPQPVAETHAIAPVTALSSITRNINIKSGETVDLPFTVDLVHDARLKFRMVLFTEFRKVVAETQYSESYSLNAGCNALKLRIPQLELRAGSYALKLYIFAERGHFLALGSIAEIEVTGNATAECDYMPKSYITLC